MKAIYINLDPYLQAVADWLNAGKPGTVPSFNPLPLAVTVPMGASVGILCQAAGSSAQTMEADSVTVDGQSIGISVDDAVGGLSTNAVAWEYVPGFSALAPSAKYYIATVTGSSVAPIVSLFDEDGNQYDIPFHVLVRRETASGPVDIVDFTPPLSLAGVSFAGVDIEGAEFDGNEIVAAADTGALSAPAGA